MRRSNLSTLRKHFEWLSDWNSTIFYVKLLYRDLFMVKYLTSIFKILRFPTSNFIFNYNTNNYLFIYSDILISSLIILSKKSISFKKKYYLFYKYFKYYRINNIFYNKKKNNIINICNLFFFEIIYSNDNITEKQIFYLSIFDFNFELNYSYINNEKNLFFYFLFINTINIKITNYDYYFFKYIDFFFYSNLTNIYYLYYVNIIFNNFNYLYYSLKFHNKNLNINIKDQIKKRWRNFNKKKYIYLKTNKFYLKKNNKYYLKKKIKSFLKKNIKYLKKKIISLKKNNKYLEKNDYYLELKNNHLNKNIYFNFFYNLKQFNSIFLYIFKFKTIIFFNDYFSFYKFFFFYNIIFINNIKMHYWFIKKIFYFYILSLLKFYFKNINYIILYNKFKKIFLKLTTIIKFFFVNKKKFIIKYFFYDQFKNFIYNFIILINTKENSIKKVDKKKIQKIISYYFLNIYIKHLLISIEHTLFLITNNYCILLINFFLKKKPFIKSSKLVNDYIFFKLKKKISLSRIYKSIKRWQIKDLNFRNLRFKSLLYKNLKLNHYMSDFNFKFFSSFNPLIGIRILCSGTFYKGRRKLRKFYHLWVADFDITGCMPLNTYKSNIEYYQSSIPLKHASLGLKVWILLYSEI